MVAGGMTPEDGIDFGHSLVFDMALKELKQFGSLVGYPEDTEEGKDAGKPT